MIVNVAFRVLFLNVLMLCFMFVITIYVSDINECIENSTPCLDFWNSSTRDWNKNNGSSLHCVNTYGSYNCVEIIKPSPPPTKAITIGMSFQFLHSEIYNNNCKKNFCQPASIIIALVQDFCLFYYIKKIKKIKNKKNFLKYLKRDSLLHFYYSGQLLIGFLS